MYNLNVVFSIWRRDILRWWRDKASIIGSLSFPLIFFFVLGGGLNGAVGSLLPSGVLPGDTAIDFRQFIFPGIVAMNLLVTSFFQGTSVVTDREFGILKEVQVAPLSRPLVAIGKTLSGATVATFQALLAFIIAPLAGVRLTPTLLALALPIMFLSAFAMTALSVAIALRVRYVEGFQTLSQMLAFPLVFLSGTFFPLLGLPIWMNAIVKLNPVSYAVDALRRAMLLAQGLPEAVIGRLSDYGLAMSLFGVQLTIWQDMLIVLAFGVLMNALATYWFSRQD